MGALAVETRRPSGQTTLADKISGFEECDDCFLTLDQIQLRF
jgi:hypothetical protein